MDDLNIAGNSENEVAGTPSMEPAESSNGTSNATGEASQSATGQESFIPQGLDLKTLPPHVRAHIEKINADMVRGFTEKTTKLSETIKSESAKAAEAYRQKAEFYDQFSNQPEFVEKWNEYVKQAQGMTPAQQDADPVLTEMKSQLQEMQQKIQLSEMTQVTEAFAEAVDEKGAKLHADFDKLNELNLGKLVDGEQAEDFSLLRACIELSPGNTPQDKLANGYKSAKAIYSAIFEEGRKAGLGRVQQKQMNGSNPPSGSGGDSLQITDRKPKSAREAMEMAKRGVMVSRD